MNRSKLLLFPGLGLDARLFEPQMSLPLEIAVAEWIEPESARESLGHYAERMADGLGPQHDTFIGGVSLGAMIALEAAAILRPAGVFVIGGCASYRQISLLFRGVLSLAAALPLSTVRPVLALAPAALKLFERLPPDQVDLMTRMLREHSPMHLRWSCRALMGWECCEERPVVPIHQIHGEFDQVIPASKVNSQVIVPGARHLINLTHSVQVNRFIEERITDARYGAG